MPLIQMEGTEQLKSEGRQPVLVFTDREHTMGLVVDEIVDIVEDRMNVELMSQRTGYVGSAVINGHATDIVDVAHYLTLAFNDWFGQQASESFDANDGSRLLLVDDSPFFRNLLAPILSVAGFKVTTAESGIDALKLRENGKKFDVIISDIEMPGMDGFAFADEVRRDDRWGGVPMVALSARTSDQDFERGRASGFTDYVAKSDREELVRSLAHTVASVTE
jgi:two-component system chemotaxis sensor kinase CheA